MTSTQHTQANVDDETDRKQLLTTTAQINGQSINTSTYFFLLNFVNKIVKERNTQRRNSNTCRDISC